MARSYQTFLWHSKEAIESTENLTAERHQRAAESGDQYLSCAEDTIQQTPSSILCRLTERY